MLRYYWSLLLLLSGLSARAEAPTAIDLREKFAPANAGPWDYFILHVVSNSAVVESAMIYVFGIFVVAIEFILLRKSRARPEEILRVFTITLIIVLSLTVLVNGSEKSEFTPIIGLFGTIIGYLLGSSSNKPRVNEKPETEETKTILPEQKTEPQSATTSSRET